MSMHFYKYNKGFTLVELLVTIIIFAAMTAFVALKYGNFSQGMLLNNAAYDIALTIRQAQSYGVSVSGDTSGGSTTFDNAFGVNFKVGKIFSLFADRDSNKLYDITTEKIKEFTLKQGNTVDSLCVGSGPGVSCVAADPVAIVFKRPDPSPVINGDKSYAEIGLKSSDGKTKKIVIRSTGQISIED